MAGCKVKSLTQSFLYSSPLSKIMEDICIKIPEELDFVGQVPNIDWSILVSKLIKSKLDKMTRLQRIVNKSKLSEKDVEELQKDVSQKYLIDIIEKARRIEDEEESLIISEELI